MRLQNGAGTVFFYDEGTNRKWEGKGQEEDFGERWGGLREENLDTFCPFSEGWHLRCRGLADVVFHCFTAF